MMKTLGVQRIYDLLTLSGIQRCWGWNLDLSSDFQISIPRPACGYLLLVLLLGGSDPHMLLGSPPASLDVGGAG